MDSQKAVNELASEIAALKEQMAAKELSWEEENQKIMKYLHSERELRTQAQQENFDKKARQLVMDLQSYATQKEKESELIRSKAELKIKLMALEDRMRCELAAKEESFQREQELQRRSRVMEEEKARQLVLDLQRYSTQKEKESELIRSEAELKIKLTALEDRMRCELAAKEESFQRGQELQRRSRVMEWRNQMEEEIKLLTQQNT